MTDDKVKLIRAITRSAAFVLPLMTLCGAIFVLSGQPQSLIIGGIISVVSMAGVFYFKKSEDG